MKSRLKNLWSIVSYYLMLLVCISFILLILFTFWYVCFGSLLWLVSSLGIVVSNDIAFKVISPISIVLSIILFIAYIKFID